MATYRRVYDSRHLQADCKEPGSTKEPYARQSSTGYLYPFLPIVPWVETIRMRAKLMYTCNDWYHFN